MSKDNVASALSGYGEGHDRKPIGENVIGQVYTGPAGANGPYLTPHNSSPSQATGPKPGRKSPMSAERLGARYAISVPMLQQNSECASYTMANAKIVKPLVNRTERNFQAGSEG